jgi:RimJ/RimL family protein N-acetyltransferase
MAWREKIRLVLRRDGVGGSLRTIFRRAVGLAAFSEDHVWYLLDATAPHPDWPLAPGLAIGRPRDPDMRLLAQLTSTLPAKDVRARLDSNNDLWLVTEEGNALFGCWIFRGMTPTIAAPNGELALPADTVCLEDSLAAPAARGRGVAPAAYAAIADAVSGEGGRWVITKIATDNASARRAAEKAGFEAVAVMRLKRVGRRAHTSLTALESPRGEWFVGHIDGLHNGGHTSRSRG